MPPADDLTVEEIRCLIALTEQEADGIEEDFDSSGAKRRVRVLRKIVEKLRARVGE